MKLLKIDYGKLSELSNNSGLADAMSVAEALVTWASHYKEEYGFEIVAFEIEFEEDGGYRLPRLVNFTLADGTEVTHNSSDSENETDEIETAISMFEDVYDIVMNEADNESGFNRLMKEIGENRKLKVDKMVEFYNDSAKKLGLA